MFEERVRSMREAADLARTLAEHAEREHDATKPFTEADFSDDDIERMRRIVEAGWEASRIGGEGIPYPDRPATREEAVARLRTEAIRTRDGLAGPLHHRLKVFASSLEHTAGRLETIGFELHHLEDEHLALREETQAKDWYDDALEAQMDTRTATMG